MKVFLLTLGTRGDVEIFLILGRELRRRGHRVIVGTSIFYSQSVLSSKLEWLQIGVGTTEQMREVLNSMSKLDDPQQRSEEFIREWVGPQLRHSMRTILFYAAGADYFINNFRMCLSRKGATIPGAFVTYDIPTKMDDLSRSDEMLKEGGTIEIVAMNKHLIDPEGLWNADYQFTGFWFDPEPTDWVPSAELSHFLSSGTQPIVFTIGSMVPSKSSDVLGIVLEALRVTCHRGLILGNLAADRNQALLAPYIYFGAEVPYRWLFARCCAVVHHGGSGTAAAAIAAGKPSIIWPQLSAQRYLAQALFVAGLATVILKGVLDKAELVAAVGLLAQSRVCETAKTWQQELARDGGVVEAVDLLEQHWRQLELR